MPRAATRAVVPGTSPAGGNGPAYADDIGRRYHRSPAGSVGSMAALDVTDATFETEVVQRSKEVARRRRPVGTVVRAVPDPRADHREGRRRHRWQGRADEGQRRREPGHQPGVPGAVDPGGVRPEGRPGRRRVRRRLPRAGGHAVRGQLLPTEAESELARLLAAGDEASLRQALELEPGNEDVIVALGELLVERGDGAEALALLERIPETERTRKVAAAARVGDAPIDDHDAKLTDCSTG